MKIANESRNTVRGFSDRVRINLQALVNAKDAGEEVHLITALITALLGVIVFPVQKAEEAEFTGFYEVALTDLQKDGWPAWQYLIGNSTTLGELLWHLRNAISHRRVEFSGEERELNLVTVTFSDRPQRAVKDNWRASIVANDLMTFTLLVADRLHLIEAKAAG